MGDVITEETTVAIIEVMKVFTTVPAGIAGTVVEICVQNEEYVEYDQVMFRVQPSS